MQRTTTWDEAKVGKPRVRTSLGADPWPACRTGFLPRESEDGELKLDPYWRP